MIWSLNICTQIHHDFVIFGLTAEHHKPPYYRVYFWINSIPRFQVNQFKPQDMRAERKLISLTDDCSWSWSNPFNSDFIQLFNKNHNEFLNVFIYYLGQYQRKRPTVYGHHRAAVQDCKHVASDDAAQVEAHQNTHAVSYLTFHWCCTDGLTYQLHWQLFPPVCPSLMHSPFQGYHHIRNSSKHHPHEH